MGQQLGLLGNALGREPLDASAMRACRARRRSWSSPGRPLVGQRVLEGVLKLGEGLVS